MEDKNVSYSISSDGSAHIDEIRPNSKGQIIVPEFIYDNGISYPVTSIGFGIYNYEPLIVRELHLPQTIVDFCVENRYLKEIHFHGDFETLSGYLLDCISLDKVVVHGSLKRIEYGTFKDCFSLKEIIIEKGNSIEIQCSAFMNCSSLECVSVGGRPIELKHSPNSFCLSAFCGCVNYRYFEGDVVLDDGLLLSPDRKVLYAIVGRPNDSGYYKIPSSVVDMLHNMAYKKLRSIDFSESQLKIIEVDAFNGCISLEEVILPVHGVEIGDRAFLGCANLKNVANFDKITKLGIAAFSRSGIQKCILSSGISEIPKSVFLDCSSLEEAVIPNSVKTIANNVFEGCSKIRNVKISRGFKDSLNILFKDAKNVAYTFFTQPSTTHYRHTGAYTHGDLNCPYCGSSDRRTYIDGTAECNNCGGEYRYW